jgi:hypothetical protein
LVITLLLSSSDLEMAEPERIANDSLLNLALRADQEIRE